MTVLIRPFKRLGQEDVGKLVEKLIREGHFDDTSSEVGGPADLQWTVGSINAIFAVPAANTLQPGRAILTGFDRDRPSGDNL
jgi:hypothetical protein